MAVCHTVAAVRKRIIKITSVPVEDRHKVIAYALDSGIGKILHRLYVILDILIFGWQTLLDIFMDINALDDFHLESRIIDLFFYRTYLFRSPDITGRNKRQHSRDTGNTRYLPDLTQSHFVVSVRKPSHYHLHKLYQPDSLFPGSPDAYQHQLPLLVY